MTYNQETVDELLGALRAVTEQFEAWMDGVEAPDQADLDAINRAKAISAKFPN